ncbi:MAG: hypothetical protein HYU86_10605 [Chloroflexi bacterium]|nr:hypothetical protein [Chloroflexota bacterium]
MFYDTSFALELCSSLEKSYAIAVLTPSESKRLIARGVAAMPEVRRALAHGQVIVAKGTTTAYVAEEILKTPVPNPDFAAGIIWDGQLGINPREARLSPFTIEKGQMVEMRWQDFLRQFQAQDVFIKGVNAVDPQGNAGILVANPNGGTAGYAWALVSARGAYFVVPVGLEKLIPSVIEASMKCGIMRFKEAMGHSVGMLPVVNALVVTEVQAITLLTGVAATHVGSGGIGGSEGSVVLALEGREDRVANAFQLLQSLKGEPSIPKPLAQQ